MNKETQFRHFVMGRCKKGSEIKSDISDDQAALLHMALGLCGEAGELADAIKKHAIYQKPLDIINVIEETGDVLFYLMGIMSMLGFTFDHAISENIEKLSRRYPNGSYSNTDAVARADKTE